jgi:serralysin
VSDIGADILKGAGGADRFVYTSIKASTTDAAGRDTIADFHHSQSDRVDLSRIDANTHADHDQAFTFIGTRPFTGQAGQLDYAVSGGNAMVFGDINGNSKADFAIELANVTKLVSSDFKL